MLRVAVIGAGFFARFHIDAWQRLNDVELVGVCDLNAALLKEAVDDPALRFSDAATMLDSVMPDLVDIATPPATHHALVKMVTARGLNAICQKPLADSLTESRAIVDMADRAGTLLAVHENIRFMPWHRETKRLIDEGAVGKLMNLSMRLRPGDGQGPSAYLERQPYFQQMPRFLVHETAIHWIDTFRYLAGECTGVFARLKKLNPAIAGEDAGTIVFDFETETTGVFDGNRHIDHETDNPRRTMGETLLEGTQGVLRIDGEARIWHRKPGGREQEIAYTWDDRGFGGDCVYAFQQHIVSHLVNGTALENSAKDYLRNIEIEELVYRSNLAGAWIDATGPVSP